MGRRLVCDKTASFVGANEVYPNSAFYDISARPRKECTHSGTRMRSGKFQWCEAQRLEIQLRPKKGNCDSETPQKASILGIRKLKNSTRKDLSYMTVKWIFIWLCPLPFVKYHSPHKIASKKGNCELKYVKNASSSVYGWYWSLVPLFEDVTSQISGALDSSCIRDQILAWRGSHGYVWFLKMSLQEYTV